MITELLENHSFVSIFGIVEYELPTKISAQSIPGYSSEKLFFVKIVGYRISGECKELEKPRYSILPGEGTPSSSCSFNEKTLEWKFLKGTSIIEFTPSVKNVEELSLASSEFFWDPLNYYKFDASITINATKISSSKVRIEYTFLFEGKRRDNRDWDDLLKISDYKNVEIGAEIEWSVGIISLKLEANLNEACASLYALGRRWVKECATY